MSHEDLPETKPLVEQTGSIFDENSGSLFRANQHTGKWPANNKEAELPEPDVYRGDSLKTLTVEENRATMIFDDKIGPVGGKIVLVGTYNEKTMGIGWQCLSPNIADISTALGNCRNRE